MCSPLMVSTVSESQLRENLPQGVVVVGANLVMLPDANFQCVKGRDG